VACLIVVIWAILLQQIVIPLYHNYRVSDSPSPPSHFPKQGKEIGHRGMSLYVPENTLWSLEASHLVGAAGSEVDITMTSDGVIVCVHEYMLEGFTNSTGHILSMSEEDLQNISVIRKSKATRLDEYSQIEEMILSKGGSVKLATFDEYLKTLKKLDNNFFGVIELKPPHPLRRGEFIEKIVKMINEYQLKDRIMVQSFFPDLLYLLRLKDPSVFTMILFAPYQLSMYCEDSAYGNDNSIYWRMVCSMSGLIDEITERLIFTMANWIGIGGVVLEHQFVTEEIVESCKDQNFKIGVWTVNRKEDKDRVRNLAVDFIISDCPTINC